MVSYKILKNNEIYESQSRCEALQASFAKIKGANTSASILPSEREALNLALLEMPPVAKTIASMGDNRYLMVNRSYCKVTGLSQQVVIGRAIGRNGVFGDGQDRKIIFTLLENNDAVKNFKTCTQRNGLNQNQDCVLTITRFAGPDKDAKPQY